MKIGIVGAGAPGCYLGGLLTLAGISTVLVGRKNIKTEIERSGIRVKDSGGGEHKVSPKVVTFHTDPAHLSDCDFVLVTVKGYYTHEVSRSLYDILKPTTVVVSLQNGVSNPAMLRAELPRNIVISGGLFFNVFRDDSRFHRSTDGGLILSVDESGLERPLVAAFRKAGIPVHTAAEGEDSLLWSKILLNLNNPINALSRLPLRKELGERTYRLCLAACMREALRLLKIAAIEPLRPAGIPPVKILPWLFSLPNFLFWPLAGKIFRVDERGRSSMLEDLDARRRTEIDFLNGELVKLAKKIGVEAPVNQKILEMVQDAESANPRLPGVPGEELLELIRIEEESSYLEVAEKL